MNEHLVYLSAVVVLLIVLAAASAPILGGDDRKWRGGTEHFHFKLTNRSSGVRFDKIIAPGARRFQVVGGLASVLTIPMIGCLATVVSAVVSGYCVEDIANEWVCQPGSRVWYKSCLEFTAQDSQRKNVEFADIFLSPEIAMNCVERCF